MSDDETKIEHIDEKLCGRPRSPTLLKLKMFADMFRKSSKIKEQIQAGEYQVDSEKIAESMLGQ